MWLAHEERWRDNYFVKVEESLSTFVLIVSVILTAHVILVAMSLHPMHRIPKLLPF